MFRKNLIFFIIVFHNFSDNLFYSGTKREKKRRDTFAFICLFKKKIKKEKFS